jgi:DNA polymerase IV
MPDRWPRTILHADMDAFYAAVEQHDRPELRGRPILVGHPGPRSVVTTASYEARPFGVGSAMPMAEARRRCPQAIVVPPRFTRYEAVSRQVRAVFDAFSPVVEPLSLDEAFLDLTGSEGLLGPPGKIAGDLKAAVREATGLTVSVGAAPSKYVAKVASDVGKPDGLVVVAPSEVRAFLAPLPIRRLWGAGPKTAVRLEAMGLATLGEVASCEPGRLEAALGSLGPHLWRLARGEDERPVIAEREASSIGYERTL